MNGLPILVVVLANALVLALGGIITHSVLKAAQRTGSTELRYLAAGFGFVTLSLLFGGIMHMIAGDVMYGVVTRAILTAFGFGFVLYSLLLSDRPRYRSVYTSRTEEE